RGEPQISAHESHVITSLRIGSGRDRRSPVACPCLSRPCRQGNHLLVAKPLSPGLFCEPALAFRYNAPAHARTGRSIEATTTHGAYGDDTRTVPSRRSLAGESSDSSVGNSLSQRRVRQDARATKLATALRCPDEPAVFAGVGCRALYVASALRTRA